MRQLRAVESGSHRRFVGDPRPRARARTTRAAALLAGAAPLLLGAACGSGTTGRASFQDGLAAQAKGQLDTARADYNQALANDPNNQSGDNKYAYFNLGVMDQQQGNSAAASSEYRRALLIDPNFVNAIYNLAIVETPSQPQSAILLYQQILSLKPHDPNTLYNLGLLLYDTGQISQGQALLRQAIQIAPSLSSKLPAGVHI